MTDPEVVKGWANVMARYNPAWGRPAGADQQCESASWRFQLWMRHEHGVEAEWLSRARPPHVALMVDELVIDLTMRQFHADAAYPWFGTHAEWHAMLNAVDRTQPNPS